jgi:hypothetical protein
MAAGDGAAEQARLAAERVARLRQQLEKAESDERAWAAGAVGEKLVAERTAELEHSGWFLLHDVHWPGRPKANLDHVAVGPGGILVVDAKNWTGDVDLRSGELRQNGHPRTSAASSALEQAAVLAALLEPRHRKFVQAWLCMVGQPLLRGRTQGGVRVEGIDTFAPAAAELPGVLDPESVSVIYAYLKERLGGSSSPVLLTTATLEKTSAAARSLANRRGAAQSRRGQGGPARGSNRRTRKRPALLWILIQLILLLTALVILLEVTAKGSAPSPTPPEPVPAAAFAAPDP